MLRVVPRVERGEALNAGVLVYCRQRDYLGARLHLDVDRLHALDPTADADAIGRALQAAADICAAEPGAGAAGREALGSRFRWLTAPRSTVIQPGPGAHRAHRGPGRRGRPAPAPARAARLSLSPFGTFRAESPVSPGTFRAESPSGRQERVDAAGQLAGRAR